MKRATLPHPIGPLEGIFAGRTSPIGLFGSAETIFVGYDGVDRRVDFTDILEPPTQPYTVQQETAFPGPANWGVRSAEGNLCETGMRGASNNLGTREQAEKWAARINVRWGLDH